jgi:DNA-binding NarL/FixJ family response regulator
MSHEQRARIVVADDDVLLREGLASLLERSGYEVVGKVGSSAELISLVRAKQPDLAIVDIRMPPNHTTDGLDAAREIRRAFPAVALMVLSAHVEVEQAVELVASGERIGYLLKSRVIDVDDFRESLERLLRGGSVLDTALVQELAAGRHVRDPLDGLSRREREILSLMAEGRTNVGIAHKLWVTERTVEQHVRKILAKLQLPEREDDHRRVLAVLTFLRSHGPIAE